jgi:hypothetical protein
MPSAETKVAAIYGVLTSSPLTVFVAGQGSVSANSGTISGCTEAGGAACEGEYEGEVTLTASAEPGSVLASWIGCKPTTANTCTVDVTEASNVVAVFITQGTKGEPGEKGEPGNPGNPGAPGTPGTPGAKGETGAKGASGANGEAGAAGANGANGEKGANGANGANGAQGPAGAAGPAGKVTVTCKVQQPKKGKKVKVTCAVKAQAGAARVHWRLSRGAHAVAHGVAKGPNVQLNMNGLHAGRYTLTLIGVSGKHATLRRASFTLR